MEMQRWAAFARHARNYSYISSSSSRIPNCKVSFSVSSNLLLRSSTSCNSSSSQFLLYISNNYNHLPPPRFFSQKITASKDFQKVLSFLSSNATEGYQIKPDLNFLQQHLTTTLHQQQQQQQRFVLKIIEASSEKIITETPNVSPHNLIRLLKLAWKKKKKKNNNNKSFKKEVTTTFTTPVLESLVSAICTSVSVAATESDIRRSKNDLFFLWELVKHIGHNQSGVLNVRILNQLILSFADLRQQGKAALEVFNKFEVFQCVPNQDTYDFTLKALYRTRDKTFLYPTAASSLCQKMLLHPETLLPDDGEKVGVMLSWFSCINLPNEAYALYLAVNEKRKRNRNWSLGLHKLIPHTLLDNFCRKKETVQLALEMLTDIDIPEEVEEWEKRTKESMCITVLGSLCRFKYFDEAKQLIFKMIADGPLPPPGKVAFNIIIAAYVKAGEMGQALEMVMLLESIGLYTCDVLMHYYSLWDGGMEAARKILEETKKKKKHSKLVIPLEYHIVICGYCKLQQFDDDHSKLIIPQPQVYNTLICGYCKLKQFDDDYSKLIIPQLYHTLICGYCKLKQFDEALELLTQMKDFGVSRPNVDEYDKLIQSFRLDPSMNWEMAKMQLKELIRNIRNHFDRREMVVWKRLGRSWKKPKRRSSSILSYDDHYSKLIIPLLYHALICGYCKLQQFDEALKLLTLMKDFGVSRPNIDEYDKLIQPLRLDPAMDWEMGKKKLKEMIRNIGNHFERREEVRI